MSFEKVTAFLDAIDAHFVTPARSEGVAQSCTATCLLLFSAADSIGGVFHPNDRVGNRERFHWTLTQLGHNYAVRSQELWELRNTFVHEAINAAFLSQVDGWGHKHLDLTRDGKILLHTRQLTTDFLRLMEYLRMQIACGAALASHGEGRLEWSEALVDQRSDTTPPPPIKLKYLIHKK